MEQFYRFLEQIDRAVFWHSAQFWSSYFIGSHPNRFNMMFFEDK